MSAILKRVFAAAVVAVAGHAGAQTVNPDVELKAAPADMVSVKAGGEEWTCMRDGSAGVLITDTSISSYGDKEGAQVLYVQNFDGTQLAFGRTKDGDTIDMLQRQIVTQPQITIPVGIMLDTMRAKCADAVTWVNTAQNPNPGVSPEGKDPVPFTAPEISPSRATPARMNVANPTLDPR